jgi:hypothetical protein
MLAYYDPSSLSDQLLINCCASFTGATGSVLLDVSGRGNHCTLTNADRNASWQTSGEKLAFFHDGVDDRVFNSTFAMSTMSDRNNSFSIWINPTTTNTRTGLFGAGEFGGSFGLRFNFQNLEFSFGGTAVLIVPMANSQYQARWTHICGVTDASGARLFLDGRLVGTRADTVAITRTNGLGIGYRFGVNGDFYSGFTDDFRLWARNLAASEVQFLYEQGRGGGLLMQPPRRRSVAAVIAALVLACETANYSLTGQAAGLFASRVLAADQAQYILSGNAANITASRLLSVDPASYTATGNDAATICARLLDGGAAAYALTGTDAGLIANRKLTADQAVCFLAGNNADLLRSLKLNAGSISLQLDNFAASLLADRKISADGAQYILVVSDANLGDSASGVAPYYYLFMMRGPQ